MTYEVLVRDSNRNVIGMIDGSTYTQLEIIPRFNRPGAFRVVAPATDAVRALLQPANGVIVRSGGVTLLSGPIRRVRRYRDKGSARPGMVEASGPDDWTWIDKRLAYPDPASPANSQALQAHDVRAGVAETVIRLYINANAGPGALAARQVPGLTLAADQARGSTVTGRARFTNLGDLVREMAQAGGGLGVRVVQVGTQLEVQVYLPVDRTATAIFGDTIGNLADWSYELTEPELTRAIVGGGGEGTARTFVERSDTADETTWKVRSEVFVDRRDTTVAAELDQAGDEALAEGGETAALSATPLDTAALRFGQEYGLGDKVTGIVDGQAVQNTIREIRVTKTATEHTRTTQLGTPGATSDLALIAVLRRAVKLIGNLQRR